MKQIAAIPRLSPQQKLRTALMLIQSARELKLAALRQAYPHLSEEELRKKRNEAFLYGRDL